MFLYPKIYLENVKKITYSFLNENNIKAIILDVDNTVINYDRKIPDGVKEWCEDLKKQDIKFCIVSNTNKVDKVKFAANELNIPYFYFAKKPTKSGLKRAINLLKEKPENIAAVGDQIFTDVWGANRCKMYSILVKPVDERDIFTTRLKRPIERFFINKYLKSISK